MPSNLHQKVNQQNIVEDDSLDKTFDKMQKLGIPNDLFGNINPNWRHVMRNYFSQDRQVDSQNDQKFQSTIQKLFKHCSTKYQGNAQRIEDCEEQLQMRIVNQFSKPKQLSQIMLCNFANKCLIRGNSIQFCSEEVMKEKNVINRECLKKLQQIEEYL